MAESTQRILVVEDDHDVAELLRLHLEAAGCEVELAHDGDTGLDRARGGAFSLVILDLVLPGLGGLEVCRRLRARADPTPILILSARSSEADRVLGLELGADDYVTKPFSLRELLARVRALLRRTGALATPRGGSAPLQVADLRIDVEGRRVSAHGRAVDLTVKEFDLLVQLARHPGRVYTRTDLLDRLWGNGHGPCPHAVSAHVNRLRAKLEDDPSRPRYIVTVWGIGYRFLDPGDARGS